MIEEKERSYHRCVRSKGGKQGEVRGNRWGRNRAWKSHVLDRVWSKVENGRGCAKDQLL